MLETADGATTHAFVAEPVAPGPHPAIVFGAEALGPNAFIRGVAESMAAEGYVSVTPDYYRGAGPANPDDYSDFSDVFAAIAALDFRAATHDIMAGAEWLRAHPQVDARRIAVWGYCTGGTLAMLAACLDRRLAAAVLFFPSQPMFETLSVKRPAHPMDLVWNIACPVQVIYGDEDYLMSAERLAELRRRLEQWRIVHDIRVYRGAKHAFTAPAPALHDPAASADSWRLARAFLAQRLAPAAPPAP